MSATARQLEPRLRRTAAGARAAVKPAADQAHGRRRFVLFLTAVLYLFGLVMITSVTTGDGVVDRVQDAEAATDPWNFVRKQFLIGLVGFAALGVALRMPMHVIRRLTPLALGVSTVLLFVVFIPGLGQSANGAQRWIGLPGGFTLQPSEMVKLAVILYLANYLADAPPPRTWMEFLRSPGGVGLGLAAVIFIQRDLGSAMVTGGVVIALYLVCGTHWKPLGQVVLPGLVLIAIGIASTPFRRDRFLAFLDPWADPFANGYQLVQGLIAIGSGGPFGVGLGHSVQKINGVPEAHTDMIYSVIAEELGLVGAAIVIVAFVALALVGMRIASRAKYRYQALLAVGLTAMLCGQAALNLAGVVGVLPLTGVPLPLVSYGGTSLLVALTSLGLLANLAVASSNSSAAARGGLPDEPAGARGGGRDAGAPAAGARGS